MKTKTEKTQLGRRLLFLTFGFLLLCGVFGVGTVWLRHEIATTGSEVRALEQRLEEIERHHARVGSEIARSVHPSFLEMQNERFELALSPPREGQVLRVSSEVQERFARMRWDTLAQGGDEYHVTFQMRDQ